MALHVRSTFYLLFIDTKRMIIMFISYLLCFMRLPVSLTLNPSPNGRGKLGEQQGEGKAQRFT